MFEQHLQQLRRERALAVDGSVSTSSFRAQVGDSFILTAEGHEAVTAHPKAIEDVILGGL
jgi:Xaa-Pro dipeptidase